MSDMELRLKVLGLSLLFGFAYLIGGVMFFAWLNRRKLERGEFDHKRRPTLKEHHLNRHRDVFPDSDEVGVVYRLQARKDAAREMGTDDRE